jgi:hypothetical protein
MNVPINATCVLPSVSTMFLPASLVLNENIVIDVQLSMRAPFLTNHISELGIPHVLSIFGRCEAGAAFVRGSRVPEVSAALRTANPWDRVPTVTVDLSLSAVAFPIGKDERTPASSKVSVSVSLWRSSLKRLSGRRFCRIRSGGIVLRRYGRRGAWG